MKNMDDEIRRVASLMGKRGWKARVKKYGLKALKDRMRKIGRNAPGRPRLADDQVKPSALYQRKRRARLRAKQGQKKGGVKHGKTR
jgi:hypothetical protein